MAGKSFGLWLCTGCVLTFYLLIFLFPPLKKIKIFQPLPAIDYKYFPYRNRVIKIPYGPKDERFVEHERTDVNKQWYPVFHSNGGKTEKATDLNIDYSCLDNNSTIGQDDHENGNPSSTLNTTHVVPQKPKDFEKYTPRALKYKRDWIGCVTEFRKALTAAGQNNMDGDSADEPSISSAEVLQDIALILPVHAKLVNASWPTMESIRQLVSIPQEIILVMSGVDEGDRDHLFGYVSLLRDFYAAGLPSGVSMRVIATKPLYKSGDNRWLGYSLASSPVVVSWDGDDYIHPKTFRALNAAFQSRPELDYALVGFRRTSLVKSTSVLSEQIINFLKNNPITEDAIASMIDYSNNAYEKERRRIPNFGQWWMGNTAAEPSWEGHAYPHWHHPICANGWFGVRKGVFEIVPPVANFHKGEDVIQTFRLLKSGFNVKCLGDLSMGMYVSHKEKYNVALTE
eukprot:Lankesteria_metandrocarpae@DN5406_c0_g1_i1.p1